MEPQKLSFSTFPALKVLIKGLLDAMVEGKNSNIRDTFNYILNQIYLISFKLSIISTPFCKNSDTIISGEISWNSSIFLLYIFTPLFVLLLLLLFSNLLSIFSLRDFRGVQTLKKIFLNFYLILHGLIAILRNLQENQHISFNSWGFFLASSLSLMRIQICTISLLEIIII